MDSLFTHQKDTQEGVKCIEKVWGGGGKRGDTDRDHTIVISNYRIINIVGYQNGPALITPPRTPSAAISIPINTTPF